ncbi:MAG: hypothetical protein U5R06_21855 [candidate division KSB1 bacterium]|nr:hypothetical protein [candidate division KSB1 bacterium]
MNRNRLLILISFCFVWALLPNIYAQDFVQSGAMQTFNRGDYDAAIDEINQWIDAAPPSQQGVALYFRGEARYNLGLSNESITLFQRALADFLECRKRADIQTNYTEYAENALYKAGWSCYRLAELDPENSVKYLEQAIDYFLNYRDSGKDAAKALYMASECELRKSILNRYNMFANSIGDDFNINDNLEALEHAGILLQELLQKNLEEDLEFAAQLRLMDIAFYTGKLYSGIEDENNATLNFNQTAYQQLSGTFDENVEIKDYSHAMTLLNKLLIDIQAEDVQEFELTLDNLESRQYEQEKIFRMGNRYHADYQSVENLIRLIGSNGYYTRSSDSTRESYYWAGFLKYILNEGKEQAAFQNFLTHVSEPINLRQKFLYEDATYRIFLSRFEKNHNNPKQLAQLARDIDTTSFTIRAIYDKVQELKRKNSIFRIVAGSGPVDRKASKIYTDVLGTDIQRALQLVKELLPSASGVTGEQRQDYLDILNVLFRVSEDSYSNETQFYKGITKSLEAEIAPNPTETQSLYQESADILTGVSGVYQKEAEYIRSRALFFAERYAESQRILQTLVRDENSARALFYLGEIYRERLDNKKARACYKAVMNVTSQNTIEAKYWYRKSQAALDRVGSGVAESIDYTVQFPDNWLMTDDAVMNYEKLADSDYIRDKKARQSIQCLRRFGLPKRELYPSVHILESSQFYREGVFEGVGLFDEQQGDIVSGLELFALDSDGNILVDCQVQLNGEILSRGENKTFSKDKVDINSVKTIIVRDEDHYPYILEHHFVNPGVDTVYAVLSPIYDFVKNDESRVSVTREDHNYFTKKKAAALGDNTRLYHDIDTTVYLRDYALKELSQVLVVHSKNNEIRLCSPEQAYSQGRNIEIKWGDEERNYLNSPEGVYVDDSGKVYITDLGNHRVLITDDHYNLLQSIGEYGQNNRVGGMARFIFPTRLAVSVDPSGVEFNGQLCYRKTLVYVADLNGVHLIDSQGHYLDTVVDSRDRQHLFYSVSVDGYGSGSQLTVFDKKNMRLLTFSLR